ncbi:MAG TPA: hypothetical protein VMY88_00120 [Acidimicrobiales bacterium]|nr:hypothetical protein [Acidimicrobiales bacterium]
MTLAAGTMYGVYYLAQRRRAREHPETGYRSGKPFLIMVVECRWEADLPGGLPRTIDTAADVRVSAAA